jgi:hypothetical protein
MENDTTFLYSIVGKEKILSIKTVFQLMTWTNKPQRKKNQTQILKRCATGTPQKTGGESLCSQVVSLTSISLLETRCSCT